MVWTSIVGEVADVWHVDRQSSAQFSCLKPLWEAEGDNDHLEAAGESNE